MRKLLSLIIIVFCIIGTAIAQQDISTLQNEMLTLKKQIENLKFKNQELQKKVTQSQTGLIQVSDTISIQLTQQSELISNLKIKNQSLQESLKLMVDKNKQKFKKTKLALYTIGIIILIILAATIIYSILERKDLIKLKKLTDQKALELGQKMKELEISLKNQILSNEKTTNEKIEGLKNQMKEIENKIK